MKTIFVSGSLPLKLLRDTQNRTPAHANDEKITYWLWKESITGIH